MTLGRLWRINLVLLVGLPFEYAALMLWDPYRLAIPIVYGGTWLMEVASWF